MFRKKKTAVKYDSKTRKPVLMCSICTGEQVAGFKDMNTGVFHEVMAIKTPKDLENFKKMYGVEELSKEY